MRTVRDHPDIEELIDWARERLPRKRHREVWAHSEDCPTCNLRLAKIIILSSKHRREIKRRARHRRHLSIAAMVVFLVGAAASWLLLSGYSSDGPSQLAALATSETIPDSYVRYRFGAGLPASSDLTGYQLRRGVEALVAGEYALAVEALEAVSRERPSNVEAAAYLGIALYLLGDDSTRMQALLMQGTSHSHPMISRAATWYLANSYQRNGDVQAAMALAHSLSAGEISDRDRYSLRADRLLRKIQDVLSQ